MKYFNQEFKNLKEKLNIKHDSIFHSVVIIDDNEIDIYINKRMLEFSKLVLSEQIFTYSEAKSAFEDITLKKIPLKHPTIIFLDLSMPGMSGFEFIEQFHQNHAHLLEDIKIMVVTSTKSSTEEDICLSYKGVIKFVSKPITINDIVSLMIE